MEKKTKNKSAFRFGVNYNPNSEEINFSLDVVFENETESKVEDQIEQEEQYLLDDE